MTDSPAKADPEIGVGLLSFAHGHQKAWGRVIADRPETRVLAVWDDDPDRGRREAEELGAEFIADVDDLLRRDDIRAVTICAENAKHADLAVKAARAGKHIMVQKPMATTVDEADRIVAAVEEAGVKYLQAHNLQFDDLHQEVKRTVDSGRIGKISVVRRRHSHHFAIDPKDRQNVLGWMTDPRLSGGGALMDEGAHAILWFLWVLGPPETVAARTATTVPGLEVEDHIVVTLGYADGVTGILQTSWTEVAGGPTIEIFGDRGAILATGTDIASTRSMAEDTRPLAIYDTDSGRWEYPAIEIEHRRSYLPPNAFVDYLAGDGPSPVDVRTARRAVEIARAAYESARTGRAVALSR